MMCVVCELDPCLCHQPAPIRDTTHPSPVEKCNKEQFGLDLYEAIACCSGVQQLLAMINAGVHKKKDVSHLSEQYKSEKEKAKALTSADGLSGEDAARLAREFPWLLT